jgi:hypothetical protein
MVNAAGKGMPRRLHSSLSSVQQVGRFEILFVLAVLAVVSAALFYAWLRGHIRNRPEVDWGTDPGLWLLWVLTLLALATMAAFLWFALRIHT